MPNPDTRRLIIKLCFRAEEGDFGAPRNQLSAALEIKHTFNFAQNVDKLPGQLFDWFIDYTPGTGLTPQVKYFIFYHKFDFISCFLLSET